MDAHGKKQDILIQDVKYTDPKTGVEMTRENHFDVWADAGLNCVINAVAGVAGVYNVISGTKYSIYTDPRYDTEFVKREIEAAILCAGEVME